MFVGYRYGMLGQTLINNDICVCLCLHMHCHNIMKYSVMQISQSKYQAELLDPPLKLNFLRKRQMVFFGN